MSFSSDSHPSKQQNSKERHKTRTLPKDWLRFGLAHVKMQVYGNAKPVPLKTDAVSSHKQDTTRSRMEKIPFLVDLLSKSNRKGHSEAVLGMFVHKSTADFLWCAVIM